MAVTRHRHVVTLGEGDFVEIGYGTAMAFTVRLRAGEACVCMATALVALAAIGLAACSSLVDKIGDTIGDTWCERPKAPGTPSGMTP